MEKLKLRGIIILVIVFISGCINDDNEANQILFKVLERYNNLATYKVTEIKESTYTYTQEIIPNNTLEEKPEKIKQEITVNTRTLYNISYKKPIKFRLVSEDNKTIIINHDIQWQYNAESNMACKTSSKIPPTQANYMSMLIKTFLDLYDIKYLGTEKIDGKEYHVIKLTPKQERNWEGDKLYEQKLWITEDYLLFRTESYENGNWKNRITYTDIEVNIEIPDEEFEIPEDAEILPKILEFSSVEEAQKQIEWEIKIPEYLPDDTELDFVELIKICGGNKYITLNYKKNNDIALVITEVYEINGVTIREGGEICYDSYIYHADTTFDEQELKKIMEPFECWRRGGAVLPE